MLSNFSSDKTENYQIYFKIKTQRQAFKTLLFFFFSPVTWAQSYKLSFGRNWYIFVNENEYMHIYAETLITAYKYVLVWY